MDFVNGWNKERVFGLAGGVAFTAVIAVMGMWLSHLPVFSTTGAMVASILIAVVYRNAVGYPAALREGVQFSGRVVLRFAVVLFGFRVNLALLLSEGTGFLLRGLATVVGAIAFVTLLSKWVKADPDITALVSIGTGVCGAAAIAAVSPILGAKEEDTALSVGIIALAGTVFTVLYSFLHPYLPMTAAEYGLWTGTSLHEIAHVAAAASVGGPDSLAIALLAKLGRVFLLLPLCLFLMYRTNRKNASSKTTRLEFPWFLLGFVACSVIGAYAPISTGASEGLVKIGSFLLTTSMVGLGLNINLKAISGSRLLKSFGAVLVSSVVLSLLTYLSIAM